MADDNKSYKLNLDKAKGQQIELVDQTDTCTVNSLKSQKSAATRQTLKLKDKGKTNKGKLASLERPKEWDNEINNTAILQDLDLVANDETKHQIANIIDKRGGKLPTTVSKKETGTEGFRSEHDDHARQTTKSFRASPHIETSEHVLDLPEVPVESYRVPPMTNGLGSVSREINAINRRLDSIPEIEDPEVRSTNSSKIMQFTPSFPKKDRIESYSHVEFGSQGEHGPIKSSSDSKPMNSRELHLEITKELLKIERLKRRGLQPSRNFSIIDKYEQIKAERVRLEEIASIESSIQFQKNGLLFVSSMIEMANGQYNNLFDLNLNGWSDSINDNIDNYEPIFEELHEKYKDSVQLAPELKLIVAFVGSAVSYHFSQQLLKKAESNIPGFGAVMANNPELKKQYTDTAAKMFAQNMVGKDKDKSNGGDMGADFLGGLLGGGGGAGGMLSGLFGGSTPAPVVKPNGVRLQEPKGLDELLGDTGLSRLSEASLRVDDDLTSHITGQGLHNVQMGASKRAVKKRN